MARDFRAEAIQRKQLEREQERQASPYRAKERPVPPMERPAHMASDSEEWRHLCECRHILFGLPNKQQRQAWLNKIEEIRGSKARQRIEKTIIELWRNQ